MRFQLLAIVVVVLCWSAVAEAQQSADTALSRRRAVLAARADSLRHLDPAREVTAALRRGDHRLIGVQGYIVQAAGLKLSDPRYPEQDAMHVVEGTSDGQWAPEVVTLNKVAFDYGSRYNRLLLARLAQRHRRSSRPAP